jgi:hypothetical protein
MVPNPFFEVEKLINWISKIITFSFYNEKMGSNLFAKWNNEKKTSAPGPRSDLSASISVPFWNQLEILK